MFYGNLRWDQVVSARAVLYFLRVVLTFEYGASRRIRQIETSRYNFRSPLITSKFAGWNLSVVLYFFRWMHVAVRYFKLELVTEARAAHGGCVVEEWTCAHNKAPALMKWCFQVLMYFIQLKMQVFSFLMNFRKCVAMATHCTTLVQVSNFICLMWF